MQNLKLRFGHLVAAHRKRLSWTQRKLAEAADLSEDMIARIEVGSTGASFASIEKLSVALKVDPVELFGSVAEAGYFLKGDLADIVARLERLSQPELRWVANLVDAALQPRT